MATLTMEEKETLRRNAALTALGVLNHPNPTATHAEALVSAIVARLGVVTVVREAEGGGSVEEHVVRVVDGEGRPCERPSLLTGEPEPVGIERMIEDLTYRNKSLRWKL